MKAPLAHAIADLAWTGYIAIAFPIQEGKQLI